MKGAGMGLASDWVSALDGVGAERPAWRRPQSLALCFAGAFMYRRPGWFVNSGDLVRVLGQAGVAERAARTTVARMVERHPGEVVVAVSHADPIKVALGDALGQPLDLVQRIMVAPCSVSVVAYGPEGPAVLVTGATGDLRPLIPVPPPAAENGAAERTPGAGR